MHDADGGGGEDEDPTTSVGGSRPSGPLLAMGAASLALVLGVGVVLGLGLGRGTDEAPEAAPVVTVTATPSAAPPATEEVVGPLSAPVRLEVPSLGIDSGLIDLFVAPDGTMGVPQTAQEVGWWEDGPVPGEPGAALIAAHVTRGGEPGAFLELGTMAAGDVVTVDRSDGSTATYQVTSVEQFAKDDFPDERVYSYEGPTRLHLVTCGGDIDPDTGHYEDNVVVFADLVSDTWSVAGA